MDIEAGRDAMKLTSFSSFLDVVCLSVLASSWKDLTTRPNLTSYTRGAASVVKAGTRAAAAFAELFLRVLVASTACFLRSFVYWTSNIVLSDVLEAVLFGLLVVVGSSSRAFCF
jgi:hypothetical protein